MIDPVNPYTDRPESYARESQHIAGFFTALGCVFAVFVVLCVLDQLAVLKEQSRVAKEASKKAEARIMEVVIPTPPPANVNQ